LGYDERPTQVRIDVAYRYGSLLVLGYAALSIMIAIFFGRRLSKPISQLQNVARSIATGNTAVDLTDEEEKDKQLLQFWRVVEQSPISIIITDAHGIIEYVNPHFCKVTGYQPNEVHGVNPRILKSEETGAEIYKELWKTITRGEIWRGEFQNKRKSGEIFWESATICPVHNQNGEITHFIALKENITEDRQKDRMLNQAMKLEAVGQMTDIVAHDFNNLLTIILGNLQYLKKEINTIDSTEEMEPISDAMSAAQDGANLIKQLLIFSGRKEGAAKPMEISAFMERVQYLLTRAVPADIDMRLEVAGDIGSVLIDSNRLESAILNLVINARDAMPGGGELVISIDKVKLTEPEEVAGGHIAPGNYITIKVADNGTGMTDDTRRQALEPFFTTKPSATGTGLGLSMVHDLIMKSGGGIRIESKEGKGTAVILILPRHEQVIQLQFRDREALDHLQTNDGIDMLFSDISMPGGMDGRQLAQHAISRQPSLNILLTTGMEVRANNDGGIQQIFPLIDKPYSMETLARSIRSVLNTGALEN